MRMVIGTKTKRFEPTVPATDLKSDRISVLHCWVVEAIALGVGFLRNLACFGYSKALDQPIL